MGAAAGVLMQLTLGAHSVLSRPSLPQQMQCDSHSSWCKRNHPLSSRCEPGSPGSGWSQTRSAWQTEWREVLRWTRGRKLRISEALVTPGTSSGPRAESLGNLHKPCLGWFPGIHGGSCQGQYGYQDCIVQWGLPASPARTEH